MVALMATIVVLQKSALYRAGRSKIPQIVQEMPSYIHSSLRPFIFY